MDEISKYFANKANATKRENGDDDANADTSSRNGNSCLFDCIVDYFRPRIQRHSLSANDTSVQNLDRRDHAAAADARRGRHSVLRSTYLKVKEVKINRIGRAKEECGSGSDGGGKLHWCRFVFAQG